MKRVLIIDDNGQDLEAFGRLLREHGYAATELVGCAGDVQDALRQTEECYRDVFENAPIGIFRTSLDGLFVSANPAMARMLKYESPAELIRAVNCRNIAEVLYVEPEHRQEVINSVLLHDGWRIFEERFRCKDGSVITCNYHLRAVRGDGGIVGLDGFAADLTERKLVEEALQNSNNLLRAVIEAAPTAIIGMDLDGNVQNVWNPAAEKMLGWSAHEVMGGPLPSVPAGCREEFSDLQERKRRGESMNGVEVSRLRRDGTPIEYSIYSSPLYDAEGRITGNIGVLVDVTERKRAEKRIVAALAEKEILLKEVHHRVKNNLQIISALLDLQSDYISDEQSLVFFRESRDRIKSMALVHERLYNSKNFASIDIFEYIENLTSHLALSYVEDPERVSVKLEIADMSLGIEEAIPCGLIINELISNSLKHAFPGGRKGEITVACRIDGDGIVTLEVRDNGVGLPAVLDFKNTETLGLQIVNLLTKQLRGRIAVDAEQDGTAVILTFPGCPSP
ncbi:MAG: PAS domain S-box protein [Deltaproteobacteria bacterium]|nr:PAS domain S-box protein [Deltaproteobacteria bacterium]